jgi:hypothetical protein
MWKKGGRTIIPNTNLVSNIGFGNNATHTVNADDPLANNVLGSVHKIEHPGSQEICSEADRFFFKNYMKPLTKWEKRFKKVIKAFNSKLKIG